MFWRNVSAVCIMLHDKYHFYVNVRLSLDKRIQWGPTQLLNYYWSCSFLLFLDHRWAWRAKWSDGSRNSKHIAEELAHWCLRLSQKDPIVKLMYIHAATNKNFASCPIAGVPWTELYAKTSLRSMYAYMVVLGSQDPRSWLRGFRAANLEWIFGRSTSRIQLGGNSVRGCTDWFWI